MVRTQGDTDLFNEAVESADPAGAVGPNDIIQADNNNFTIYNKTTGTVEQSESLDQFWLRRGTRRPNGGGVDGSDVLMNAYEPQVVYDSASGRWYVSSLDNSNPPYTPFDGNQSGTWPPTTSCWLSPRIPIRPTAGSVRHSRRRGPLRTQSRSAGHQPARVLSTGRSARMPTRSASMRS